jgi:ParB family chromosome partitioning protein
MNQSESVTESKNQEVALIPVKRITPGTNILRGEIDIKSPDMRELMSSILDQGILSPIVVYRVGEGFELLCGFRRFTAALEIGLDRVPGLIVATPGGKFDGVISQAQENLQRVDICPIRFSEILLEVKNAKNCSNLELAAMFHISTPKVCRGLQMATASAELKRAVSEGSVPFSIALELQSLPSSERDAALSKVLSRSLTRDELTGQRKRSKKSSADSERKLTRATATLGEGRTVTVAGQALDLEGFISALEFCLARARKARPLGTSLSTFLRLLQDQTAEPQPL